MAYRNIIRVLGPNNVYNAIDFDETVSIIFSDLTMSCVFKNGSQHKITFSNLDDVKQVQNAVDSLINSVSAGRYCKENIDKEANSLSISK